MTFHLIDQNFNFNLRRDHKKNPMIVAPMSRKRKEPMYDMRVRGIFLARPSNILARPRTFLARPSPIQVNPSFLSSFERRLIVNETF